MRKQALELFSKGKCENVRQHNTCTQTLWSNSNSKRARRNSTAAVVV